MQDNITLIPYRDNSLIFWDNRIIGTFCNGVNFITEASFSMKSDAICELLLNGYIVKELAEYLFDKLCFRNIKNKSPAQHSCPRIHIREYSDKILIFSKEYIIAKVPPLQRLQKIL